MDIHNRQVEMIKPQISLIFLCSTSDIDIMPYYTNGSPPRDRSFAAAEDVKRLIGIADTSSVKECGACPTP